MIHDVGGTAGCGRSVVPGVTTATRGYTGQAEIGNCERPVNRERFGRLWAGTGQRIGRMLEEGLGLDPQIAQIGTD